MSQDEIQIHFEAGMLARASIVCNVRGGLVSRDSTPCKQAVLVGKDRGASSGRNSSDSANRAPSVPGRALPEGPKTKRTEIGDRERRILPNEPKKSHEISYIRFACCFL